MMDARDEAHDLAKNPLPPVVIMDPLTRVWDIDGQISALAEQMADLQRQRTEALDYALQNNIEEDSRCRLDRKVRKTRALNIDAFAHVFPDQYRMCCDIERKEKEEALNHIGERINLTLVDRLIKKPALEAAQGVITVKESVTYGVVLR